MTDKEHLRILRTTLQGIQQYVVNSNPRSLRGEDQEAKVLAVIAIEAALNIGDDDPTLAAPVEPVDTSFVHPLNPKMGKVIDNSAPGETTLTA